MHVLALSIQLLVAAGEVKSQAKNHQFCLFTMRRFLTPLQTVGILVAFACFSEVCDADNNTTTGATITTGSSTTSTPNMTTAVSNMTTAVSNMTTAASNMTTAASNMTTAVSNMTTATGLMTTKSENTTPTGTSASSSPAPEARWKVNDKDGKLCMLMDFEGTVTSHSGTDVTKWIPSDANTAKSKCSSSYSAFVLEFGSILSSTEVVLNFTNKADHYQLNTLSVGMFEVGGFVSSSISTDFFDVAMGDYYNCSYFNYSLGSFTVNFTNPKFQPFVQKTNGGNSWGEADHCGSWTSGINTIFIICAVIVIVIIIAVIVGVTICIVKRRRKASGQPYSSF